MSDTSPITGYRVLNEQEIELINECKATADVVGTLVTKVRCFTSDSGTIDPRWVAIAQTHLQEGFMALIRSIARPTTF